MDYQFLLGKTFCLQDQVYVVSALSRTGDVDIVRATTRVRGENVMRTFPAHMVVDHLVSDEQVDLTSLRI